MKNQTRRKSIINSVIIVCTIICTAILGQGQLFAQKFPDSDCNSKNNGAHKILIAYASESGSTAEVAEAIGGALCEKGYAVETKWIKNVNNISNYDAVIVGSAIIYENWLPEAREFVKSNQDILKDMPVAYFITCMAMVRKEEAGAIQDAIEYSDKLCELVPDVKPVSIGRFAGVLDYSKIPFLKRILAKAAMAIHKVEEGDYRDWDAIRSWAKSFDFYLD